MPLDSLDSVYRHNPLLRALIYPFSTPFKHGTKLTMTEKNLARFFDHTLLSPLATKSEIGTLCNEAVEYDFFSVCVAPYWVPFCVEKLENKSPLVCTVIGFPLGYQTSHNKLQEAQEAIDAGATELDMVINIGALRDNNLNLVEKEIRDIVTHTNATIKVIVESGALTPNEIQDATKCVNNSGAHFIKTSTGFYPDGASLEQINIMKEYAKPQLKIKASGGIRRLEQALSYIEHGVHRIGASQSCSIIDELGD